MPGRGFKKPKKILTCPNCPYTTERWSVMEDHKRVHTGDRPFKCELCGKCFTQKSNLGQHLKVHGAGKQHEFKCDVCDFVTKWKTSLLIHQRMHSGEKPYRCTQCDKSFSQSTHCRTHMRESHQEVRKFQCEICSKCFKRQDHLDRHMLFHSNARNHECDVCQKRFNDPRSLKVHKMIHQGDATKIYTCDLCPYKARYRQALKIHYRFHSGVRPYPCDFCSKTFVTSQTKKLHMILVHKGFASKIFCCDRCSYTTPYKPHLKNHIKKVHLGIKDNKSVKCPYCSKIYSNHGSLISHKRKKHPRLFQREKRAKREKKELFMKACAEKVQPGAREDLKLDTLTSVSHNEEKDVKEYLDSIQVYLKNKMDRVSVQFNSAEQKTSVESKVCSGKNLDPKNIGRRMTPQVHLERISVTSERIKVSGNENVNDSKQKVDTEKASSEKLSPNKSAKKKKSLPKCLPHIVLKLPTIRRPAKAKPKQKAKSPKQQAATVAAVVKPSAVRKRKKPVKLSQPQIVYENADDCGYQVPVCSGSALGDYQVIGTVVSQDMPNKVSSRKQSGAKNLMLLPNPSNQKRNNMVGREFDSLRALASSYVEAESCGVLVKTEPVEGISDDCSVVPMSLITHTDAVQQGPYADSVDAGEPVSDAAVKDSIVGMCTIQNQP